MSELCGRFVWLLMFVACAGCAQPAPVDHADQLPTGLRFLAEGSTGGYERALAPRPFEFPADHGSHPSFKTEWWYFTGNVLTDAGRHFGFQLTFFRYALTPQAPERESAWATNQVWMAHFAVTDTANGKFIAEERLSRGALGLAGARSDRFDVWVENFSAAQTQSDDAIRLSARGANAEIELVLDPTMPIVAEGLQGLDAKGPEPGNASYYYSWPRLKVTGTVTAAGDGPEAVKGTAWLDREWGTSALSPGVAGWTWFALELDDGRDIMIYRLRNDDGSANAYSSGALIEPDGRKRNLGADEVRLEALETWKSDVSGTTYPVAWKVEIPNESLTLDVRPMIPNQEIALSVRYWEGAVTIEGRSQGQPVAGYGYLELAGY